MIANEPMEITHLTFDDIIRTEKSSLVEQRKHVEDHFMLWGKKGIEAFSAFNYIKPDMKEVFKFGILHRFDPNAEGYKVLPLS